MHVVADRHPHACLFGTVFTDGGTRFQPDFLEFSASLVLVQEVGSGVIGHKDIRTPGVVEIAPHNSQSVIATRVFHSGCPGEVAEGAIAIVVKKGIAGTLESPWTALHVDSLVLARRTLPETRQIVEMEVNVVG